MNRIIPLLLFCLLLAPASSTFAAAAAEPAARPLAAPPPLDLRRALDLAEQYVAANRVDLSRQHLRSARLLYDEGSRRRGPYWHFQWAWTSPAMGGEYGLRVYMDGMILPERLGP